MKCCLFDVPLVGENTLKVHQFVLYSSSFRYEQLSQENTELFFFSFCISNLQFKGELLEFMPVLIIIRHLFALKWSRG